MAVGILERLKSDEFAAEALFVSTASALRRFLAGRDEVAAIREGLRQGAIGDDTIRSFVSVLMRDLRYGERFPHELPLAALAVALELRSTDFADEFLHDLSALRLSEMSICIRVARECVRQRMLITQNVAKHFGARHFSIPFSVAAAPNGSRSSAANEMCKVGLCQP